MMDSQQSNQPTLHDSLAHLSEKQREKLILEVLSLNGQPLSIRQVATLLGRTDTEVHRIERQALAKLRLRLSKHLPTT